MLLSSLFFMTSPKMIPNNDLSFPSRGGLLPAILLIDPAGGSPPLNDSLLMTQILSNLFPQTRAGAMQGHSNHKRRGVHDAGDFAVTKPLKVTQSKHLRRRRSQP